MQRQHDPSPNLIEGLVYHITMYLTDVVGRPLTAQECQDGKNLCWDIAAVLRTEKPYADLAPVFGIVGSEFDKKARKAHEQEKETSARKQT